tara:strand:+ start:1361 stop:1717 length:357 start_codon:yes stop_codon:yes gene_type:complete
MRAKTIICDIDGVILTHLNAGMHSQLLDNPLALKGSVEKLSEWDSLGYNIILLTGRRESSRRITEEYLENLGVFYDQLIMGVGGGSRILINDRKPNRQEDTAFAVNLTRNQGLKNVEL